MAKDETTDRHPADLPRINSVWRARDGRRMRVDQLTRPADYPETDYWARLTVLPPYLPRQRRSTTMSVREFRPGGFMELEAVEDHV